MTAGLSHEIRNPLNAAALQLIVLERRVAKLGAEEQAALLEPLPSCRTRSAGSTTSWRTSSSSRGRASSRPRPLELVALLDRVLDFLDGEAERRSVGSSAGCEGPAPVARRRGAAAPGDR